MGKELAVQGCTFKASVTTGSISAQCSTTTPPSTSDLASNKGIYFDKVTVIVPQGSTVTLLTPPPGATSPTGTLTTADTIDIDGTGDNILDSSGNKALLKGDSGHKTITFTFPAPNGTTVPYGVDVTVEVDDSGQDKVIAL